MAVIDYEAVMSPYLEQQKFGATGEYQLMTGVVHFAVDPTSPPDLRIVDLELTKRDRHGQVAFDADFRKLCPTDRTRANNKLCFVVDNRGRATAVPFSVGIKPVTATEIDPGDGYFLQHGWTIAWCGWQWDMLGEPGLLGLRAPEASIDGASISGQVRMEFRPEAEIRDHLLAEVGAMYSFQPYPAEDVFQEDAVLRVRDGPNSTRTIVDRTTWRFAHDEDGEPVTDATMIWLEGGFAAQRWYKVIYRTNRSPVVGAGLLATRDLSRSRWPRATCSGIEMAFGHGISQSGRDLCHFIYEGLNLDEQGRAIFDGVLPHIAGARRGEFNSRYAQPSHLGLKGFGALPPYSIDEPAGLYATQTTLGAVPKTNSTNTSWEYWRGDACFNHINPATDSDSCEGPDHRNYLLAGTDHLGDSPAKADVVAVNPLNPLSYMLLLRAAFSNLVDWVTDGTEPPTSRVPRTSDRSAALREEVLIAFSTLPGAVLPDLELLPVVRPIDLGPGVRAGVALWPATEGPPFTSFVASIDTDGNEIAGIRLPELVAPVATYTGWNPTLVGPTQPRALQEFPGARFAFPATKAERLLTSDPRLSIEERYPIRAEYERLAAVVVDQLVTDRLLLECDAALALKSALDAYDQLTSS